MATLTVKRPGQGDFEVFGGTAAAGGGDVFPNTGTEILIIQNTSGGNITLTISTPGEVDGLAIDDLVLTLSNSTTTLVGPFQTAFFNNSSGQVSLAYSGVSNVLVSVIGEKSYGK